jgi:hypothetical protein
MSDNSKIIEITTKVEDIFPKDQFTIQILNSNAFSIKTEKDNCLLILIKESQLYINFLSKCGINGTESLRRIEEVVKNIPYITDIGLQDGSEVYFCDYRFSLAILKILTNGHSWYNSLGYTSATGDTNKEKSINEKIINMSYNNFMDNLVLTLEKFIEEQNSKVIKKDGNAITLKHNDRDGYYMLITKRRCKILQEKLNKLQEFNVGGFTIKVKDLEFSDLPKTNNTKISTRDILKMSNDVVSLKTELACKMKEAFYKEISLLLKHKDLIINVSNTIKLLEQQYSQPQRQGLE